MPAKNAVRQEAATKKRVKSVKSIRKCMCAHWHTKINMQRHVLTKKKPTHIRTYMYVKPGGRGAGEQAAGGNRGRCI